MRNTIEPLKFFHDPKFLSPLLTLNDLNSLSPHKLNNVMQALKPISTVNDFAPELLAIIDGSILTGSQARNLFRHITQERSPSRIKLPHIGDKNSTSDWDITVHPNNEQELLNFLRQHNIRASRTSITRPNVHYYDYYDNGKTHYEFAFGAWPTDHPVRHFINMAPSPQFAIFGQITNKQVQIVSPFGSSWNFLNCPDPEFQLRGTIWNPTSVVSRSKEENISPLSILKRFLIISSNIPSFAFILGKQCGWEAIQNVINSITTLTSEQATYFCNIFATLASHPSKFEFRQNPHLYMSIGKILIESGLGKFLAAAILMTPKEKRAQADEHLRFFYSEATGIHIDEITIRNIVQTKI